MGWLKADSLIKRLDCTHIQAHTYTQTHTIQTHIHTYTHKYAHTHSDVHTHAWTCTCSHTHIQIHIHSHVCTHTHTCSTKKISINSIFVCFLWLRLNTAKNILGLKVYMAYRLQPIIRKAKGGTQTSRSPHQWPISFNLTPTLVDSVPPHTAPPTGTSLRGTFDSQATAGFNISVSQQMIICSLEVMC